MSQIGLPGVSQQAAVGSVHGEVYTPDKLARALVRVAAPFVRAVVPPEPDGVRKVRAIDGSVGGGALIRACEGEFLTRSTGVDLRPQAEGLRRVDRPIVGDWPTVAATMRDGRERFDLGVLNPPFGAAVGPRVTVEHVRCLVGLCTVSLVILPADYVCSVLLDNAVFSVNAPKRTIRVIGRPWGQRVRNIVAFLWAPGDGPWETTGVYWREPDGTVQPETEE